MKPASSILPANKGVGLYLHWPFCVTKCPYCDFNSYTGHFDPDIWQAAYIAEIARAYRRTPDVVLNTIYLGGGTPSLMPVPMIEAILNRVRETWRTVNDLEITLEANPSSVERSKFEGFRDAGVNRLSLGLQALDDDALRKLGRPHTAAEGLRALDIAQKVFGRVSGDLIYARQDQRPESWRNELGSLLASGIGHVSLYQLTIEEGTIFARRAKAGQLKGLPDEDLSVEMFAMTQDLTASAGLPAYEVSNHAKPGAESRHNMIYWRGGVFMGIGPGAHGRVTINGKRHATVGHRNPTLWLRAVADGVAPEAPPEPLSNEDICTETLLMGLRMNAGVALNDLAEMGHEIDVDRLSDLIESELVVATRDMLRVTEKGRILLNAITAQAVNALRPVQRDVLNT